MFHPTPKKTWLHQTLFLSFSIRFYPSFSYFKTLQQRQNSLQLRRDLCMTLHSLELQQICLARWHQSILFLCLSLPFLFLSLSFSLSLSLQPRQDLCMALHSAELQQIRLAPNNFLSLFISPSLIYPHPFSLSFSLSIIYSCPSLSLTL